MALNARAPMVLLNLQDLKIGKSPAIVDLSPYNNHLASLTHISNTLQKSSQTFRNSRTTFPDAYTLQSLETPAQPDSTPSQSLDLPCEWHDLIASLLCFGFLFVFLISCLSDRTGRIYREM